MTSKRSMHRGRKSGKYKSSLNIWLYTFYFPARSFYRYHSQVSCWKHLPKNRRNKDKSRQTSLFSDVFSLPVHFEFFAIFSYCLHFTKFVYLLKRLQRLKQEQQKSPASSWGTKQTYGKKTRFGQEKQKENLPNYQRLLLPTVLPLKYFMFRC